MAAQRIGVASGAEKIYGIISLPHRLPTLENSVVLMYEQTFSQVGSDAIAQALKESCPLTCFVRLQELVITIMQDAEVPYLIDELPTAGFLPCYSFTMKNIGYVTSH